MAKITPVVVAPVGIGWRARVIRRQLGLSRDTAAGLAGISRGELAELETGRRWFERRGLVEDLATALGCSVTDLTGQPYLPVDQASADALAAVQGIREAIYGPTLDEPDDLPARPLAGRGLGALLAELHTHAAAKDSDTAQAALPVLVKACHLAGLIAERTGHSDLVLALATRGRQAATRTGDPVTLGLAHLGRARAWTHAGARRQADAAIALALAELEPVADPTAPDTGPAELLGLAHLLAAALAARTGRGADAHHHLGKARALAERTGERNGAGQHFGPTLVALGALAVGTDLGHGPHAAEQASPERLDVDALHSRVHTGRYHFHRARALAQDTDGTRDTEAIRHLALADRAAPVLLRNHPIARELLAGLTYRARRQARNLDRMVNRFGMTGPVR